MTQLLQHSKAIVGTLLLAMFLVGCGGSSSNNRNNQNPAPAPADDPGPAGSIVDIAVDSGDFETLVAALQATGLDATLADESATFTVFAPTDDAFAVLGEDTINALLADTDTLADILLYHVIGGQAVDSGAAQSLAGTTVEMANGDSVAITLRDGALFINDSQVVTADIEATNGVIHVIDAVLIPPADMEPTGTIVEVAQANGNFSTLVAALQATGLDATLADETGTFTVFAPTDDAFALLGEDTINALLGDTDTLSDILLYHVIAGASVDSVTAISLDGQTADMANGDAVNIEVRGGNLFINDSQVVLADVPASNGVIHVIDAVLLPPSDAAGTTIVDVAVQAGSFSTLIAALQATGLDSVLADESQEFTVFAPTDDAFAKLGEDTINALLADPDTLSDILLYHALPGKVDGATALSLNGSMVEMANGSTITISRIEGELFINDSRVVTTDIMASNGIIHVINTVLIPPVPSDDEVGSIVDVAVGAGSFTTLVAALEATGLDATLADPDASFTVFAPTDDAFALLGEDTINALLGDPDTLSNILLYHVVPGAVDAMTALSLDGSMVETANGDSIALKVMDGELFINESQVVATDIMADNGIIHVIDMVLTPPDS